MGSRQAGHFVKLSGLPSIREVRNETWRLVAAWWTPIARILQSPALVLADGTLIPYLVSLEVFLSKQCVSK